MAVRTDIQYVQYRVEGTAAKKLQNESARGQNAPVRTRRRAERKVIAIDPVAMAGIVLSVIVVAAMVVGLVQYRQSMVRSRQMSAYVASLEEKNAQLAQMYKDGYDPDEIRDIAEQAGMVPAENQTQVSVKVEQPGQEETEMSFWDSLTTFLTGIFA